MIIHGNATAAISESCSYCGSRGGECHWCRPRSGKPLVNTPKLLLADKTQNRKAMTLLGISVLLGCAPFAAQAASDATTLPWSLVAPGTSAGAIILVVLLMLRKIEKADAVYSETIKGITASFSDSVSKSNASFVAGLSEISRSTQDNLREIRDSIRDLSTSINTKKE